MNNIEYLAFKCAVIGFVYSQLLTSKGHLLNWLWHFLDKRIGKYPYLFKPLIDCYVCVTGQMFLWSFTIKSIFNDFIYDKDFAFNLVYGISLSLLIVILINFIHARIKEA